MGALDNIPLTEGQTRYIRDVRVTSVSLPTFDFRLFRSKRLQGQEGYIAWATRCYAAAGTLNRAYDPRLGGLRKNWGRDSAFAGPELYQSGVVAIGDCCFRETRPGDRGELDAMRHRRSHRFTPPAIEIVRRLAAEGKSASEIADVIGSTAASVRVRCCQLKIKLAHGTYIDTLDARQRPIQEENLTIRMHSEVYAGLEREAARMQKSAAELARTLLEAIVSDGIYAAVLDERD
jgi:hypothetical protein